MAIVNSKKLETGIRTICAGFPNALYITLRD